MPYRKVKESESGCSVASDSLTPWTVAHQASPSMGFSRQEYWSGLPVPFPEDLPNPGIKHIESKNKGQTRVSNSRTLLTILDKDSCHANKPRFH